jgi:AMMECR1 domain-containing protein
VTLRSASSELRGCIGELAHARWRASQTARAPQPSAIALSAAARF